MGEVKMGDEFSPDEVTRVRARIHNLADKVQGHELELAGHGIEIERNKQDVQAVRMEMLTQVAAVRADAATKTELQAFTALATEKMSTLQKSVDKANDTLGKVAWIVITAVIMALLGVVLRVMSV